MSRAVGLTVRDRRDGHGNRQERDATNGNCAGVTYSQRVDLPDILDFINRVN